MDYKLALQLKDFKGKNNPRWLGMKASYYSKHQFLTRNFGKPNQCSMCWAKGKQEKGGRWSIQWAKKLMRKYTHNIDDYIPLCRRCHSKYDFNEEKRNNLIKAARMGKGIKSKLKSLIANKRKRNKYGHFITTKA